MSLLAKMSTKVFLESGFDAFCCSARGKSVLLYPLRPK